MNSTALTGDAGGARLMVSQAEFNRQIRQAAEAARFGSRSRSLTGNPRAVHRHQGQASKTIHCGKWLQSGEARTLTTVWWTTYVGVVSASEDAPCRLTLAG